MKLADILVFRGVSTTYTYLIPEPAENYCLGMHVDIPLGASKAQGLIVKIHDATFTAENQPKNLKALLQTTPKRPILSQEIIDLIYWLSAYYLLTPDKAYQTVVGKMKLRKLSTEPATNIDFNSPYPLTPEQQAAIAQITNAGADKKYLLFGVTASGKTEVYLQIAAKIIASGQTVLMLLPEIALTPQTRRLFKERFGNIVAVIHSGLTAKEREIEWNRIYQSQVKIVIGPRSAIFCPLQNLGLIIVDEEHEPSYKQESNPRYLLHTVAHYRAQINHAIQIYGSATPGIETFHEMQQENNDFSVITLKNRVLNLALPQVQVVDLKNETEKHCLSNTLLAQIQDRLQKKEKIIILINRRGFSTYISCQKCQSILTCPQCNLSYTYHKDKTFRCHRCDNKIPITNICPKCHKPGLAFTGTGIQKVESELQKYFPQIKICRIDRDLVTDAQTLEDKLDEFAKSADLLLGTQMIAKGLHFEDVTLVGVLGIDTTLNLPDFRASERTFQLITQVAGRAGRSQKPGLVIVQTFQPDHPAIEHAINHDFTSYYEEEITYRRQLFYPPFASLINLIITSKNEAELQQYCETLSTFLTAKTTDLAEQLKIIGPKPAPFEKIKDYYRYNVLLKCQPEIIPEIKQILSHLPQKKLTTRIILDFDPKSIL